MTKLMQVQGNGCILYFPNSFPYGQRYRGAQGYVVDLDAPCEAEWCQGQEHKLIPAPKGAVPSEILSPLALRLIREFKPKPVEPAPEKPKPAKPTSDADLEVRPRGAQAGAA